MSEPLPSGEYFIEAGDYTGGSFSSRPLGKDGQFAVVLPKGASATKWTITSTSDGKYTISIDQFHARPDGDNISLTNDRRAPFEWTILRTAPSPPPIGSDNFGINVNPEAQWHYDLGDSADAPKNHKTATESGSRRTSCRLYEKGSASANFSVTTLLAVTHKWQVRAGGGG
ncbi:hypothetical protein GLOTRDRAFT_93553 [Gloeophyllum trabeum ATCC 11539]|uniref:Uncharacterized protein n=1 Tax=Gloeophyllum trabeum (strain ATCC 11539 / FP-39264 / Madison 617) TaxID=670483 RepID=S7RPZ1_GLOTA|nr:uncharacterized protein GLOTRDRAFT_93553 [Gloeophyllum trabeum ATCC 11539]EPQ54954.1 hypothetical protein GLOTRDRAFT_93553 [Gloeophyllum trabeum ATCC 11539]